MNTILALLCVLVAAAQVSAVALGRDEQAQLANLLHKIDATKEETNKMFEKHDRIIVAPITKVICGDECHQKDNTLPRLKSNKNLFDSIVEDSANSLMQYIQTVFKAKQQQAKEQEQHKQRTTQPTLISCSAQERIEVLSAAMSNKDIKTKCPMPIKQQDDDKTCDETTETLEIVTKLCDGKQECEISLEKQFASICDDCTRKYLELTYSCISNDESNQQLTRSDRSKRALQYFLNRKATEYENKEYNSESNSEYSKNKEYNNKKSYNKKKSYGGNNKEYANSKEYSNNKEYATKEYAKNKEYSKNKEYAGPVESRNYGLRNLEVTGRHHEAMNAFVEPRIVEVGKNEYESKRNNKEYRGNKKEYEGSSNRRRNNEVSESRRNSEVREGGRRRGGFGVGEFPLDYYGYGGFGPFDYYGYGGFGPLDYYYGLDYLDYYGGYGLGYDYYGLGLGYGGFGYGGLLEEYYDMTLNGWGGWGDLYDYVTENYIKPRKVKEYKTKEYNTKEYANNKEYKNNKEYATKNKEYSNNKEYNNKDEYSSPKVYQKNNNNNYKSSSSSSYGKDNSNNGYRRSQNSYSEASRPSYNSEQQNNYGNNEASNYGSNEANSYNSNSQGSNYGTDEASNYERRN